MPDNSLDDALRQLYRSFDVPADEIIRQPHLTAKFCDEVRSASGEIAGLGDDDITRRLIQLRKRGESSGGLPRIRR
jgi:hypothetical protein